MPHHQAFDAAPFPIVVHQDGRIVYRNAAMGDFLRFLGYEPDGFDDPAADVFALIAPEERDDARANQARLLRDGRRAHAVPRTLAARDGRRHHFMASSVRTRWEGRPALWVAILWASDGSGRPGIFPAGAPNDAAGETPQRAAALAALSPRERQVADLVAEGFAPLNIAALLELSESTVRGYLKSIYRKLEVHSQVELTRLLLSGTDEA